MDRDRMVERVRFLRMSLVRLKEKENELKRELDRELERFRAQVCAAARFRGEVVDAPDQTAAGDEAAAARARTLRVAEERALVEQCLSHPVKGKRARLIIREIEDVRSRIARVQRELALASQVPN